MGQAPSLVDHYAGVVLDLDGVLIHGDQPIPGAGAVVAGLRERGVGPVVATNNASRTPTEVATALEGFGIGVDAHDVVTSAVATLRLLRAEAACLVIGTAGLRRMLAEHGCRLTDEPAEADTVVVGWDPELRWDDLRRATLALHRGARFVGTNPDVTYPAAEGPWPGNGATLAALTAATGRTAEIAGKPHPPLFEAAAARLPDGPLLMVGDRHETDIVGAAGLGWDTALMLTGVTAAEAVSALSPPPTYVLGDLAALLEPGR